VKGVKQFLEVKLHEIRKYYPDWEYIRKGILMVVWQIARAQGVPYLDRQCLYNVDGHLLDDEALHIPGEFQAVQPALQGHLPRTRRTEKKLDFRICDSLPRCGRKPSVVSDPPEKGMRIEQKLQPSKLLRVSASRGSSKSAEILILPFALPGILCPPFSLTGVNLATGLPAFAMTISSPCETLARSFERLVFASWTLTIVPMGNYMT